MDHYRILEPLGGGGMGVVYRAEDLRLGRTVALKFLPPELTRDPVAKARFLQEARTASALDHPNICTIYDVGETPDARLYLAMPCYDGETLRQRLESGPLPVEEAVDVAWQVGRGLAKAHRQGIVHRDVKPANLMLTADGVVKILDFGIAKLAGSVGITRTGLPLGTPAYMSPEQMRGAEVDARTDLWSLGVVFYEMLTGRRPFPGDHEAVVRYGILNGVPEPLSKVRPGLPKEVEKVLAGLLAKDLADRFPTAEHFLDTLRPLVSTPSSSRMTAAAATLLTARAGRPRSRAFLLAALLAAAGLGLLLWLLLRPRSEAPLPSVMTRLTEQPGIEWMPSPAPTGDFFVYVKRNGFGKDIFLQRSVGGPRPLTADSPGDDTEPAYSPDGNLIAFRSAREGGGIFIMGATGESVHRLTHFGYDPAWSPDGKKIVVSTAAGDDPLVWLESSRLWQVEVATQERHQIAAVDAVQPSWSPHGQRIAYWSVPPGGGQRSVWTIPAAGGEPVRVTDDDYSTSWSPDWSPDGRYLFFASDRGGSMSLWRVPIDEDTGKARGWPEAVTNSSQWNGPLRVSRDGKRILYVAQDDRTILEKIAFDPAAAAAAGPPISISQSPQPVSLGTASPDGQWLVFRSTAPQEDLFLVHPDGTGRLQLTRDTAKDRGPLWMPDGRILFFSNRSGAYEAWAIRPDASGLTRLTDTGGQGVYRPVVSPDNRWLVCALGLTGTAMIDLRQPSGKSVPAMLPTPSPGQVFFPESWSPDGRRLAGTGKSGDGLFVFDFTTRTYEKLADRATSPLWMRDGQRILYLGDGEVRVLDSRTKESRSVLAPSEGSSYVGFDLSPDGRILYLGRSIPEGDIWMLSTPEAKP